MMSFTACSRNDRVLRYVCTSIHTRDATHNPSGKVPYVPYRYMQQPPLPASECLLYEPALFLSLTITCQLRFGSSSHEKRKKVEGGALTVMRGGFCIFFAGGGGTFTPLMPNFAGTGVYHERDGYSDYYGM